MKTKRTKKLGKVARTSRGFEIIEFKDRYDEPCSLQMSSLADYAQPGISAVWLGCEKNSKPHHMTGESPSPRMHLDRKQVEALVGHLSRWLENGSFA
jgi:hypothetical protein